MKQLCVLLDLPWFVLRKRYSFIKFRVLFFYYWHLKDSGKNGQGFKDVTVCFRFCYSVEDVLSNWCCVLQGLMLEWPI
jgi:hypothetical protein